MNKGKLIVLEGLDKSGKETQAKLLRQYLEKQDYEVSIHSFPYYESGSGALIRRYLAGMENLSQKTINMVYSVNRYEQKKYLENGLNLGIIIICDRYYYSNMAYGTDEDNSMEDIMEMDKEMPQPNHVILIDIDPKVSQSRNNNQDINEKNLSFLTKVRENYLYLAKENNWTIINGDRDKEKVHKSIISKLEYSGILK